MTTTAKGLTLSSGVSLVSFLTYEATGSSLASGLVLGVLLFVGLKLTGIADSTGDVGSGRSDPA